MLKKVHVYSVNIQTSIHLLTLIYLITKITSYNIVGFFYWHAVHSKYFSIFALD